LDRGGRRPQQNPRGRTRPESVDNSGVNEIRRPVKTLDCCASMPPRTSGRRTPCRHNVNGLGTDRLCRACAVMGELHSFLRHGQRPRDNRRTDSLTVFKQTGCRTHRSELCASCEKAPMDTLTGARSVHFAGQRFPRESFDPCLTPLSTDGGIENCP